MGKSTRQMWVKEWRFLEKSISDNWKWIRVFSLHPCIYHSVLHLSRLMTKPTKWTVRPAKTQMSLGMHPVWSESSLSAWRNSGPLTTYWAHSEDSDQTWRMPRLIWVFAGCTGHIGWFCHEAAHLYIVWFPRFQTFPCFKLNLYTCGGLLSVKLSFSNILRQILFTTMMTGDRFLQLLKTAFNFYCT